MSSRPRPAVAPLQPQPHDTQRMWIAKVNPQAFAVGLPVPMELGAKAGIFPGGRYVALRTMGECLVVCPVESLAPGDVQREADKKFIDTIEAWTRRHRGHVR